MGLQQCEEALVTQCMADRAAVVRRLPPQNWDRKERTLSSSADCSAGISASSSDTRAVMAARRAGSALRPALGVEDADPLSSTGVVLPPQLPLVLSWARAGSGAGSVGTGTEATASRELSGLSGASSAREQPCSMAAEGEWGSAQAQPCGACGAAGAAGGCATAALEVRFGRTARMEGRCDGCSAASAGRFRPAACQRGADCSAANPAGPPVGTGPCQAGAAGSCRLANGQGWAC